MAKKPRRHFIKCTKCGCMIDRTQEKIIEARRAPAFNFNFGYIYHVMMNCPPHVFRQTSMSDISPVWDILGWGDSGNMITIKDRKDHRHPHWLVYKLYGGSTSRNFSIVLPRAGHRCWRFKASNKIWLALYVKEFEKAFYINIREWRSRAPGSSMSINRAKMLRGDYDLWETVLDNWFWTRRKESIQMLKERGSF